MEKTSATTQDIMRQLNTKVKTALDGLKKAVSDPAQSDTNIINMIDVAYREIISIIALLPAPTTAIQPVVPATPTATPVVQTADDEKPKQKAPLFWRKNLDYGERK